MAKHIPFWGPLKNCHDAGVETNKLNFIPHVSWHTILKVVVIQKMIEMGLSECTWLWGAPFVPSKLIRKWYSIFEACILSIQPIFE